MHLRALQNAISQLGRNQQREVIVIELPLDLDQAGMHIERAPYRHLAVQRITLTLRAPRRFPR